MKYIENISDAKIGTTEMPQDDALVYEVDFDGREKKEKDIIELN